MTGYVLLFHERPSDCHRIWMMVFREREDAERSAGRCAYPVTLREVKLVNEPRWVPRKMKPEHMVAWCDVWVEGGRLVAKQQG